MKVCNFLLCVSVGFSLLPNLSLIPVLQAAPAPPTPQSGNRGIQFTSTSLPTAVTGLPEGNTPTALDLSFQPSAVDSMSQVTALSVQSDRKLLVSANLRDAQGNSQNRLLRLTAEGALDPTFRGTNVQDVAGVVIQPDGKILVWDHVRLSNNFVTSALARLLPDGSIDSEFHADIRSRYRSYFRISRVLVQPDGRILVGGAFDTVDGETQNNLVRLNSDGSRDPSFQIGTGPSWVTEGQEQGSVEQMLLAPNGQILISGNISQYNSVLVNQNARVNPDGAPDLLFINALKQLGSLQFLDVRPNGHILAQSNSSVFQLTPDGAMDPGFAPSPNAPTPGLGSPHLLQPDGKLLFATYFYEKGVPRSGIWRLNTDGSLDSTLPSFEFRDADGFPDNSLPLFIQADGRLVAGGRFATVNGAIRPVLVRLFADPSGPPTVTFLRPALTVSEDVGLAQVVVQRLGDATGAATVEYAAFPGTALPGREYIAQKGTLTFTSGETAKALVISILNDDLPGPDMIFSVRLTGVSAGSSLQDGLSTIVVTIADNERPGSLDASFAPVLESTNGPIHQARIALQSDGRIVVAGPFERINGVARNSICRLNSDGSLDLSFDPKAGLVFRDEDGNLSPTSISSVRLQADGKILVRGSFNTVAGHDYPGLVRFNPDGSLDATFTPDPIAAGFGQALAIQPDGKILIGANRQLARLETNGGLDKTFEIVPVVGAGEWRNQFDFVVVQPDQKILFQTDVEPAVSNDSGQVRAINRLNPDRSIDSGFKPVWGYVKAAAVQSDGTIWGAGYLNFDQDGDTFALARRNPDGSPDPSFLLPNDGSYFDIRALAIQPDGKPLLAAGDNFNRQRVTRYRADGSKDFTFDVGSDAFALPDYSGDVNTLLVQPDGRILVSGSFTSVNGISRTSVARLNGDRFLTNAVLRFDSIVRAGDQPAQMVLRTVPARQYGIEQSADLRIWTPLSTATAANYLDRIAELGPPGSPGASRRFFRAHWLP